MIKEAISKAMNKENLTREEALQVMKEIMSGEAEQSQVAAFLVALHMKGETAEEISACAEGMRSFATKLDRGDMDVIDIVGTGGDRSNTPCRFEQMRNRRLSRDTRCQSDARAGEECEGAEGYKPVLSVRTEISSGDALCRSGKKSDRCSDRV